MILLRGVAPFSRFVGGDGGNRTPVRTTVPLPSFTSLVRFEGSCLRSEPTSGRHQVLAGHPRPRTGPRITSQRVTIRPWRETAPGRIGSVAVALGEDRSSVGNAERRSERILDASDRVGNCQLSMGLRAHRHVRLAGEEGSRRRNWSSPCHFLEGLARIAQEPSSLSL